MGYQVSAGPANVAQLRPACQLDLWQCAGLGHRECWPECFLPGMPDKLAGKECGGYACCKRASTLPSSRCAVVQSKCSCGINVGASRTVRCSLI